MVAEDFTMAPRTESAVKWGVSAPEQTSKVTPNTITPSGNPALTIKVFIMMAIS